MSKKKRILNKYGKPILSKEKKNYCKLFWKWTGFGDKKLWDYLQLLIVPFTLIIAGTIVTSQYNLKHQEIVYQQETFSKYLDQMDELLLDKRIEKLNHQERNFIVAKTRNILQILDQQRKELLVMFLFEADLISQPQRIIHLTRADLNFVDLSHRYLFKVDLGATNLNHSNLKHAFMKFAILAQAELKNANISHANLNSAFLRGTNFNNADLSHTNLSKSTLYDAKLIKANLSNADLSGANLIKANLQKSNLAGIKLQNALYNKDTKFPRKFDFTNHQMYSISPRVQLQKVKLQGRLLEDVNLQDANLTDTDLSGTYLGGANLSGAKLNGANLDKTNLARANLTGSNLEGTNLDKAILCNTTMPDGSLSNRDC